MKLANVITKEDNLLMKIRMGIEIRIMSTQLNWKKTAVIFEDKIKVLIE